MRFTIFFSLLLFSFCYSQTCDTVYTISGTITNYKPGKSIYFAIYASENDFKQRKFYRKAWFKGNELPPDTIYYKFTDIEEGEYVIAGYQDINGDGKLNMSLFGPVEPYRIYQPNYGIFGPKFDKCKFRVAGDIDTAHIVLK